MYIHVNDLNGITEFVNSVEDSSTVSIGTTWDDYLNGKWIKLSEEQINFMDNNQYATIEEIWNMKLQDPNGEIRRINDRIISLKKKLRNSDYKIIKAYEAQLIDGAVTYDFEQVHVERQKMRDEINELETILAQHTDDKE